MDIKELQLEAKVKRLLSEKKKFLSKNDLQTLEERAGILDEIIYDLEVNYENKFAIESAIREINQIDKLIEDDSRRKRAKSRLKTRKENVHYVNFS